MEINNRKSIFDELKKYDYHCNDEHAFVEITQWSNGEGWDIIINDGSDNKLMSLTYGQLEAINYLIKALEYKNVQIL